MMKFRLATTGVVILSTWGAAWAQEEPTAFENGTIVPVSSPTIPLGHVVFHRGVIVSMGPGDAPEGIKTINLERGFLYPGWIDSYLTRGLNPPAAPTNPELDTLTTIQVDMRPVNRKGIRPDLVAADCLDMERVSPDLWGAGFVGANIAPSVGSMRGMSSLIPALAKPTKIDAWVPQTGLVTAFTTGPGSGFPGTSFGVMALLRQTMWDAARYPATKSEKDFKPQPVFESLQSILTRQAPMIFIADNFREIWRASQLNNEFGTNLVLVGAREGYRQIDVIRESKATVIATFNVGSEPRQSTDADLKIPEPVLNERKAMWRDMATNLSALEKAGIPWVASSAGDGLTRFLLNLRELPKYGLTQDRILRSLTLDPARLWRVDGKIGSLEVGKQATFTIFSGDAFSEKSEVKQIVISGDRVFPKPDPKSQPMTPIEMKPEAPKGGAR